MILKMFLTVNIAEFLKTLSTNCSEAMAWILGIIGTIGTGTIIAAIISIVKSKIQSKNLINVVNTSNKENYNMLLELMHQFKKEIEISNLNTVDSVVKYGQDNAIVGELLLMIAGKIGFSNDEIVKVANKYRELPKSNDDVANIIISSVTSENIIKEEEIKKAEEKNKQEVENINLTLDQVLEQNDDSNIKINL